MARAIREATIALLIVLVWGSVVTASTMLIAESIGVAAGLLFMVLVVWLTCVLIALEDS